MRKNILLLLLILSNMSTYTTITHSQTDKRTLKIGLLQMKVLDNDFIINLSNAEKHIPEAKRQGADIVLLPECFDIGWANQQAPGIAAISYKKVIQKLSKLAHTNKIFIVAGVTEYDKGVLYNSAFTFNDKGKIINKHRKINLVNGVENMYRSGTTLNVFETPFGTIGVSICADNLKESLAIPEALAQMGAEIILSPSSWAVPPDFGKDLIYGDEWREPYTIISEKYHIPVVGVSNVGKITTGPWKDWLGIGNSIYTDKQGNTYHLPFGEDAEWVEIVELEI